jgi:hypothetical protein
MATYGCAAASFLGACRSSTPAPPEHDADVVEGDAPAAQGARRVEDPPDEGETDTPFPFAPVVGERTIERPCGPNGERACIILAESYSNWAWGYRHSLWFLAANGHQYTFSTMSTTTAGPPKKRAEDSDVTRKIFTDGEVTPQEFAQLVAASQLIPEPVSHADVQHALALLAASNSAPVEGTGISPCPDAGGSGIEGFVWDPAKNAAVSTLLESTSCHCILKQNVSPAARELSQWVHRLRGERMPQKTLAKMAK